MGKIKKVRGSKNPPNIKDFNNKFFSPDLDEKNFNSLVYSKGVRARVYRTLFCPNVKSIDGMEHDINCKLCGGSEFIDVDPIETQMFVQGHKREFNINPQDIGSNWEEQTVIASFLNTTEVSYFTRVDLLDYSELFKDVVQRQESTQTILSFTPDSYDSSTGFISVSDDVDLSNVRTNQIFIDSLGTRFVIRCEVSNEEGNKGFKIKKNSVVSIGASTIETVNVDRLRFKAISVDVIIDEDGKRYYDGSNFIVDRNGDIEWVGDKPADKKTYGIHYYTLVSYRCMRALHSNRYASKSGKTDTNKIEVAIYPQQWVMKKLYLFDKNDSESGAKLLPNKNLEK